MKLALPPIALAGLLLVATLAGGVGGIQIARHRPDTVERWIATARLALTPDRRARLALALGDHATEDRIAVDCADFMPDRSGRLVLLAFGQSNSANYGEGPRRAEGAVANFNPHDGLCYRAADPLLGADGTGAAVWTRLGEALVRRDDVERVLIIPFGVGDSSVADWAPEGWLHPRLLRTLEGLGDAGLSPTHVLWHQGERDAELGTPPERYLASFTQVVHTLREHDIVAPILPAIATACLGSSSPALRALQQTLPHRLEGLRPGPDSDTLDGFADRATPCHFSDAGLTAHAKLWTKALVDTFEVSAP